MYTVLYVDDSPDDLDLGRIFLERDGRLQVDARQSALEGLAALRERAYDAIISDYQMPGMDGIAFLQAVRIEFGDVPFVLFTGRGREEVAIAAINNGADRYVQKGGDPRAQYAELAHGVEQAVLRREAQRDLRLREQEFRRLMDNARDLVYRMALPEGAYTFVSQAAVAMTGYAPEEFYDDPGLLSRLVHPAWQDYLRTMWEDLISGSMPPTYEYQIVDRAGRVRWINQRNVLVTGDDGQPVAIEGIATDVTARKEAEQELRMSEQRFRRLFEQIPVGIAVVGRDLRFRMVNPALCRLTGREAADLEGQPFEAVTESGDVPISVAEYGRVIRGEVPFVRFEKRYRVRGTPVRVLVTVSPIRDEQGAVEHLLSVIEEIPGDEEPAP